MNQGFCPFCQSPGSSPECPVGASGRRLERHPASDARRFAGIERHVQMLSDEIRSADPSTSASPVAAAQHVSRRGGHRHRPRLRVAARTSGRAIGLRAPQINPDRGGAWASSATQPHALEHAPNQVESPVDVPTCEELFRRSPLQLHAAGTFSPVCGAQVRLGGFGGRPALARVAASPSRHVCHPGTLAPGQRMVVEGRGAIEKASAALAFRGQPACPDADSGSPAPR